MKFIKCFNKFELITESEVKHSRSLYNQISEYVKEKMLNSEILDLIKDKILPTYEKNLNNKYFFDEKCGGSRYECFDLTLQQIFREDFKDPEIMNFLPNKVFAVELSDIVYTKDTIIKGVLILNEIYKVYSNKNYRGEVTKRLFGKADSSDVQVRPILHNRIREIIQNSNYEISDISDLTIGLNFVFFFDWGDTSGSFVKNLDFGLTKLGTDLLEYNYMTDPYLMKCQINFNALHKYDIYGLVTDDEIKIRTEFESTIRHELIHLTQFVNTFFLNVFENARDFYQLNKFKKKSMGISSKEMDDILDIRNLSDTGSQDFLKNINLYERELLGKSLKQTKDEFKVGLPKTSFRKFKKNDQSYHDKEAEFKTWMSQITRQILRRWIISNQSEWEKLSHPFGKHKPGSKEELQVKSIIDELTGKVLKDDSIKKIPGDKLKERDIRRLLKNFFEKGLK